MGGFDSTRAGLSAVPTEHGNSGNDQTPKYHALNWLCRNDSARINCTPLKCVPVAIRHGLQLDTVPIASASAFKTMELRAGFYSKAH